MGKRDPQKAAKHKRMTELLQELEVTSVDDIKNLFKEMIGSFLQNGLEGELDAELGYGKYDYHAKETENSRNGHSSKKVKTSYGEVDLAVPRDRNGKFEPELIKKHQRNIAGDIEEKILSMYAKGMSTSDIESHISDIYGLSVSDSTVSRITDRILPMVREWQSRPLERIYAVVYLDAVVYHVRGEGQIIKKAVHIAIGITVDGQKEVLGMWIGGNESATFWLSVLNSLRSRGVEDILIACIDGLKGFPEAIEAVYPTTDIQHCILHQIRSSTKHVASKDKRELLADLKEVYGALDEPTASENLEIFAKKWDVKYPGISKSWRANWPQLCSYFKYPPAIRKMIYTTNAIESFNRQLRKVTKSKSVFPTDESLLKMLYLATMDITRKWTGSRHGWFDIYPQLAIYFKGRLPDV